jgi:hypothetical protein
MSERHDDVSSCPLCGEDGWEVIGLAAQDAGTGVREELHPRQLCDCAVLANADGVAKQVSRDVLRQVIAGVHVPVLLCHLVHLLHTFQALGALEHVIQLAEVLIPQRHTETVDLATGWLPG